MAAAYALADCNNFYASCERVIDPALNEAMSRRVMKTLRPFTPQPVPYSIDGAFLELPKNLSEDWSSYGRRVYSGQKISAFQV